MSNFESINSMQNSSPSSICCPKDVYGPVDQSYGQRVLLASAWPDGDLLAFGQAIAR